MKKFKPSSGQYSIGQLLRSKDMTNHPFVIPVSVFLVMFSLTVLIFISWGGKTIAPYDSKIVKLSIDGQVQTIPTRAKTVKELLQRAEIKLNEGDLVEPAAETEIIEDNFRVNIHRAYPVTILDGDKRIQTLSAASSPRSVATRAGLNVFPEDNIQVESTDGFLQEGIVGQKIVIKRATPVFINLYGTSIAVRTHSSTVGELVKEKNIVLAPQDQLTPAPETTLTNGTLIFVIRAGSQIVSIEEAIAAPQQFIDDPNLSFGTNVVRQVGSKGKKVVTYQIETANGREVNRKIIQSVIAIEPVTEIVARGRAVYVSPDITTIMHSAGIAESDYAYVNYIISRESGWCPTKWQGQIGYCPASYQQTHDPNSGWGYGLCQSTPAIKMATAGSDWTSNPATQLKWCSGYATGRYGSWSGAYSFWLAHHWW